MNYRRAAAIVVMLSVHIAPRWSTHAFSDQPYFYQTDLKYPLARATVNKIDQLLLVDTFAPVSCLFRHRTSQLHLMERAGAPISQGGVTYSVHPDTELSLAGLAPRRMAILSIPGQEQVIPEIAGLVGVDYLRDYVLYLRQGSGILRITPPGNTESETTHWQPLSFINGCPVMSVSLTPTRRVDFKIDTGFNGLLELSTELAKKLSVHEVSYPGGDVEAFVVGGAIRLTRCWVREMRLSDLPFRNVPTVVGDSNVIGMMLLSQFEVTIDFPGRRIRLVPDPDAEPLDFRPGGSGLVFVPVPTSNGFFTVSSVEEGTTGEAAGVQKQDELVSINDQPVKDFRSPRPIYELLRGEGRSVRLEFQRNGERRIVEFTLRYPFTYPPEWPPEPVRAPLLPDPE